MVISQRLKDVNMPSGGGVFGLLKDANEKEKQIGKDKVIKSVIGSLFDEDENFFVLPIVEKTFKNLPAIELFNYAAGITGSNEYKESVKKNIFGSHIGAFDNSFVSVVASAGGTGAIHNAFKGYMDVGQTVLIPDIAWESYTLVASANGLKYEEYKMFDGQGFNLVNLREKTLRLVKKDKKVLILLNDPCQNPTGYSLSDDEWKEIVELLKEASKFGDVILVNDVAYIDYDFRGREKAREHFKLFVGLPENIISIIAFSISKALTGYGLRLGAEIAISSSKNVIEEFNKTADVLCRTTWSNVNRGAMALFVKIMTDEVLRKQFEKENKDMVELLKQRSDYFISEAKKVNLDILPFEAGFFLTVPVKESILDKVVDKLKEKNVFVLKLVVGLRIAICSMPKEKCKLLPAIIKAAIEESK
jgi:aspartate/tyrosine/aromatic aminotransferase